MQTRNKRALIMAGVAFSAIMSGVSAMPAFAQDAPVDPAADEMVQEVVVTGTRIRRPNLKSASPITTVDAAEVKLQGATGVDSFLAKLPQIEAGNNENQSNNSDGTAGVNLRSLGGNRALVLIDGQRFLPTLGVDLNFVPSTLVERTDVLTGGASSVYGSDAMSGVVNFIMRKKLNGVRVDAQYSIYNHHNDNDGLRTIQGNKGIKLADNHVWDGEKYDFNIAAGGDIDDGKGNITGYFGYRKMEAVRQDSRDYSNCALQFADAAGGSFSCGGSGTHAYGWFLPQSGPSNGVALANSKDGSKTWVANNSSFAYNYAPDNYTLRNSERYQAGAFANYTFNDHAEAYGSFMFMDDHSVSQVAPSAIWSGRDFTINCANPFMSAQQGNLLCGSNYGNASVDMTTWAAYRAATGTPRRNDMRHTNYRFTAGLRGDIVEGWRYDANYMHATTIGQFNYQNDINQDKAEQALNAVTRNGQTVCFDESNNCKPFDIFSANGPSAEAYAFVYAPTFTRNEQTIDVFNAYVSGDLGQYGITSPWAEDGLAIVLGAEHRKESLDERRDESQLSYASNADGKVSADEWFTEIEVPIAADKPFIRSLNASLGYRSSTYNVSSSTSEGSEKKTETSKFEVRYAPTSDILFRASYNKAMRAANITELFASQAVGNVALIDPCSVSQIGALGANAATLCARTGATPAQLAIGIIDTQADVGTALGGGNPDLSPEEAETKTYGFVFTPGFVPGLALSVDYYEIHIDGYIGSVQAQTAVSQCLNTGDAFYCGLIRRNPNNGALYGSDTSGGYVISTNVNTGYLETKGIDFSGSYLWTSDFGNVNFSFVGTLLDSLETEVLPGLGSYDCKGYYGATCGQPSPEWRHNLRATWTVPGDKIWAPTTVSINWRHFGETKLSTNSDDQYLTGTKSTLNAEIKPYNYIDIAVTKDLPYGLVARAGINNLFDKDPPAIMGGLLAENGNGNTFPSTYDPLGRMLFIGISSKF
ncbi:TonB-dependent receptor domain-containing protein [Asticcacaulis machinosus]|uniref:TonB-dependent receptor n=1 Tax=Asticcacaulis machinosus TaxID=2984211 RepID=A0ABT5HIA5_9CAUL|nr:TonB-dependent receptor [Asticcacaulis machinosus]MDC7675973.1 TonB-dependent receptor [Asticcacaulis machinosus]